MMEPPVPDSGTSLSLLGRLRDERTREAAWHEFLARYGQVLYRWCRQWGLQPSDAEDTAQETLLAMVKALDEFEYDPQGSFRAWMRTIAYRFWLRAIKHQSQRTVAGGSDGHELLNSVEARDDLTRRFDLLAHQELAQRALEQVQTRVEPQTWEAFRLFVLEEVPCDEVAQKLGMRPGAIYMARYRVQRFLREAIQELDPESQS